MEVAKSPLNVRLPPGYWMILLACNKEFLSSVPLWKILVKLQWKPLILGAERSSLCSDYLSRNAAGEEAARRSLRRAPG